MTSTLEIIGVYWSQRTFMVVSLLDRESNMHM